MCTLVVDCDACEGTGWIESNWRDLWCHWCKGAGREEIEIVPRTEDDMDDEGDTLWHARSPARP